MNTVFSHIVQKRLSQEYEDIATEALAFIIHSNESARSGLMKFLRGIEPNLPSLLFRTQETDGNTRPDMCGCDGTKVRVFIENKFWAGLTENQPVKYLECLATCTQPSVLLMVVPATRQETMWRQLRRRIEDSKVSISSQDVAANGIRSTAIGSGCILALTSWERLLSAIKAELTDEPQVKSDLLQLSALCDAADSQAFAPISPEQVTDQRIPAFFLQLNLIVQGAVKKADEKVLSTRNPLAKKPTEGRLAPTHTWKRVGRYVCFPGASAVGAWFGTEFTLWKDQGSTPLWLVFEANDWQRGSEVRAVLEPWAGRSGVPSVWRRSDDGADEFAVGIELATGEEEEAVIASVSRRLEEIATELSQIGCKLK